MANIKRAIINRLDADTGIAALVGKNIYSIIGRQKTKFPQIVVKFGGQEFRLALGGKVLNPTTTSLIISIISNDSDEVETIADLVIQSLLNKSGTWDGVVVQGVFHTGTDENIESPTPELNVIVRDITFDFKHNL